MRAGRISSKEPLSRKFGFDRGTPIDRAYIESFLSEHASDIAGRVLEVGDDSYSSRFGADRVTRQDILNLDPHAAATFVGDLGQPGVLPVEAFDCIILTQTLQYVFDCATAVDQLRAALRPGGVLLMTVPGISSTSGDDRNDSFYWTFTRDSVSRLLNNRFDSAEIEVRTYGNLYAATAFLHGAALQEVQVKKLKPVDPHYAVTIAARAVA